jgi:hypothetical protein
MKRIIDGLRYDTSTATEVASWSNHHYRSDFAWCEETLYRTANGAWFIDGEGGPSSKYAVPVGNNERGGGGCITPLGSDEARAWLEERDEHAALEQYFADELKDA